MDGRRVFVPTSSSDTPTATSSSSSSSSTSAGGVRGGGAGDGDTASNLHKNKKQQMGGGNGNGLLLSVPMSQLMAQVDQERLRRQQLTSNQNSESSTGSGGTIYINPNTESSTRKANEAVGEAEKATALLRGGDLGGEVVLEAVAEAKEGVEEGVDEEDGDGGEGKKGGMSDDDDDEDDASSSSSSAASASSLSSKPTTATNSKKKLEAGTGGQKLWVDKYSPKNFSELLSAEQVSCVRGLGVFQGGCVCVPCEMWCAVSSIVECRVSGVLCILCVHSSRLHACVTLPFSHNTHTVACVSIYIFNQGEPRRASCGEKLGRIRVRWKQQQQEQGQQQQHFNQVR